MQSSNRDADVKNGCVDAGGDGEGGVNWETGTDIYTLPDIKCIASGKLLYSREPTSVLCDDLEGWGVWSRDPKGRGTYTYS